MAMIHLNGLPFSWISGKQISDTQLEECSALYENHYGIYGEGVSIRGVKPGDRIRMKPKRMRALLAVDGAYAALAHLEDKLVAYAFLVIGAVEGEGVVSWVTQLVVHTEYRNQKVATRLLHAAWGLSDRFAWGLATANPFAVRALEGATRRSCDPAVTFRHLAQLRQFTSERINYFENAQFYVDERQSIVDTRFFVNHSTIADKMERLRMNENTWPLGVLRDGMEWCAVTFRSQPQRRFTVEDLDRLLADQDGIVKEAYARMLLDTAHRWMKATSGEVDQIIEHLGIAAGATVLDAGCGIGRHAIELAKRGYQVVGVDFVPSLVQRAAESAQEAAVADRAQFIVGDCRNLALGRKFDGAICLYDVVGSFPHNADNNALLQGVANHIRPGGRLLMSVLNRGLVEAQAIHRGPIGDNLDTLLRLQPSNTMQKTGEIFNPQYYFYDSTTGVVYRKEQFTLDNNIPCELIVRDRRYTADELHSLCRSVGIEPLWTRHVRMGKWDDHLAAHDPNAKEVLLLGESR